MIALKAIHQGSFVPKRTNFFYKARLSNKEKSTLCLCNSVDSDPEGSSSRGGDPQKQELLARIAQLQAQKVRLTDYLDEKFTYLSQFAEETDAEFGKIGEDALKELDKASDRIMENIKSQMQEFEEVQELNRLEIEMSENELEDLQDQMIKDRNEGLFFQNLGPKTPTNKAAARFDWAVGRFDRRFLLVFFGRLAKSRGSWSDFGGFDHADRV